MADVFISYSRRDSAFVRQVFDALIAAGRDAWIDWEDIPPTADWWAEIRAGIDSADSFLFIISPNSARSQVCYDEVEYATQSNKRIIPIVWQPVTDAADAAQMHPDVNRHNWIFFNDRPFEDAFQLLLRAMDTDLDYVRGHTRLLMRAREWEREEREDSFLLRGVDLANAENLLMLGAQKEPRLTDLQTTYILASRRASIQRQRFTLASVIAGLVVAVALALLAFAQYRAAESNLTLSLQTQSLFLADLSRQELEADRFRVSLLLALEAVQNFPRVANGQSNKALLDALNNPPRKLMILTDSAPVTAARWSSDQGGVLSIAGALVRVWDVNRGLPVVTLQHAVAVGGAAWNVDRTQILTWAEDGVTRLWDPTIETEIVALVGHQGPVRGALWSADETQILTWGEDGTLRLWNAADGAALLTINHSAAVIGALWGDDTITAWAGREVRVWRLTQVGGAYGVGAPLTLTHDDMVRGARWNTAGERLLTWSADRTARLWDAETGATLLTLAHDTPVNGAAWGPDPTRLITWSEGGGLAIWSAADGASQATMRHDGAVVGAAWSRDGMRVLSWSEDRSARLWDVETGAALLTLTHEGFVGGAAWDSAESHILTWSNDSTTRVWDAGNGAEILRMQHNAPVSAAAWSPDNDYILSAGLDGAIQFWTIVDRGIGVKQPVLDLPHPEAVNGAAWNADQTRALTWSNDGVVRVWNLNPGALPNLSPALLLVHETALALGAAWSPDEGRILSWSNDGTVRIWDAATGRETGRLTHDGWVRGAAWTADGAGILSWANDGTVRLRDVATGAARFRAQYPAAVTGAALSPTEDRLLVWTGNGALNLYSLPDGAVLFSGAHERGIDGAIWDVAAEQALTWARDRTVRIWDLAVGTERFRLSHDRVVLGAAWNRDRTRIISWTRDDVIWLWNGADGASLATLPLGRSAFGVNGARWDDAGGRVLAWSSNGVVRLWDTTARPVAPGGSLTLRHGRPVDGAAWNADESRILSWSNDGTARVWNVANGAELLVLRHTGAVDGALWSVAEDRILTWTSAGEARQWVVDVRELIDIGRERVLIPLTNAERQAFFLPTLQPTSTPSP